MINLFLADAATKCGYGECPPPELPLTGLEVGFIAIAGLVLISTGILLRLDARRRDV